MSVYTVLYRQEDGLWWAESPDLEEFVAGADRLKDLRERVREGLEFFTEDADIELVERYKVEREFRDGTRVSMTSTGVVSIDDAQSRNAAPPDRSGSNRDPVASPVAPRVTVAS